MSAPEPQPFDVCGPLPEGTVVLEASAGTGKTFTIAALAARYVAEGTPLEQVLLVTFTRMATGELRERVRERLVTAEQGLDRVLAGLLPDAQDEVVTLLASGTRAEVELRRDRLSRALSSFDAATIATTHGFCQEVLGGLGVAGDVERDVVLVEDLRDLVEEVVDDLYVRRFHNAAGVPAFPRKEALAVGRAAVDHPDAAIEPSGGRDDVATMRARLAEAVRREVEVRKRRLGILSYDDLLTRLKAALDGPGGGAAAARLQRRWSVVLVDEFQDTDPVQWEILQRAFGEGGTTLVLIGDPKQAIYAFRGADVYAYLRAAQAADQRATLTTNWRSDQGLIDAYDTIFAGTKLGHAGIAYRRVRAADANQAPRLHGAPVGAPLRLRVVHRLDGLVPLDRYNNLRVDLLRERIAEDVAGEVARLLASGAELEERHEDGTTKRRRPVEPGDVAVLVYANRSAAIVRDALDAAGVPAVISGAGSVFGTAPAREWLRLLEALERPASAPRARSAALTCFFGWSPERVASASEADWEDLHRRLHQWARVLRERGIASLTEAVTLLERLPGRLLAGADGERRLTDLRHVGQLLHATATAEQLGTTALTSWLRRRVAAAAKETGDEERSRRLESDAAAVQVLTIHRSKGLEFPVVCFPYLWDPGPLPWKNEPVTFHDPDREDRRTVDVGLEGFDFREHHKRHVDERRDEELRLAYVALTRAKHQALVWWAGSRDARHSALGRLLFAREEDGTIPSAGRRGIADPMAVERFAALADAAPGCVSVERVGEDAPGTWTPPADPPAALAVARFDRTLDWRWRRTSYSDITADAHEARVASEPEEGVLDDELADDGVVRPSSLGAVEDPGSPLRAVVSPLAAMPAGATVGTVVHEAFEAVDFAAADVDAELRAAIAAGQARRRVDLGDADAVVAGLRGVLETPLGGLVGDLRLRDLARADRLDELDFELPLAGGDRPSGRLDLRAIAAVLRAHVPPGTAMHGYAERLEDPALRQVVRGYLTGSIDLVLRLPDGRFAVVDYKTNWLGVPGEELSCWHHRPAALEAEVQRAHYGLQALLYTAALHRYLRWRLAGYDPDRHLAGVLYLFLRGMVGPETPRVDGTPCGVWGWRPSGALVHALSDVLDAGA